MAAPITLTEEESEALSDAISQIENEIENGYGDEAYANYQETLRHLKAMQRRVRIVKCHRGRKPSPVTQP